MAEEKSKKTASAKKTETKKVEAPKKTEVAKKVVKKAPAKTETVKAEPVKASEPAKSSTGQTVAITILATVLTCFVIVLVVLFCTGVIRFGNDDRYDDRPQIEVTTGGGGGTSDPKPIDGDDTIIDNPNKRVSVKNGHLVEVGDLEFYLPNAFKAGGKNDNGAYTYNLVNDDGWAQVLVYTEKSALSPEKYLEKISPYLDVTDDDYEMNGTKWVQAENGSTLAYATKLDGKIYAVYYAVKLDSKATSEAMSMIPKTLYMKKVYKD